MVDEKDENQDEEFPEPETGSLDGSDRATGTPQRSDGLAQGDPHPRRDARRRLEDYLEEKRLRERICDYLSE